MSLDKGYWLTDKYWISPYISGKWTQSAVDCYKLGCNCNKCNIPLIMETPCQMKRVVITLVALYGVPDLNKFREDNNSEI